MGRANTGTALAARKTGHPRCSRTTHHRLARTDGTLINRLAGGRRAGKRYEGREYPEPRFQAAAAQPPQPSVPAAIGIVAAALDAEPSRAAEEQWAALRVGRPGGVYFVAGELSVRPALVQGGTLPDAEE